MEKVVEFHQYVTEFLNFFNTRTIILGASASEATALWRYRSFLLLLNITISKSNVLILALQFTYFR